MDLVDQFKSPEIREHLERVALRIEEELDWLEGATEELASVKIPLFLPETTLCVMQLADLFRIAGPYAKLPPDLKDRLDGHRGTGTTKAG